MANLEDILSKAIKANKNVLLIGRHGVGKTAIIKKVFNDAGIKWMYFSASTMDPHLDFIGLPKEKTDDNGVSYIDIVRPKAFAYDEVEALFFDEFNRSHKRIRNAVMELTQFQSINGKKFPNLKFIWAAINPHDENEEYDVEKLDPAQLDRFHLHIEVPYRPDRNYFKATFGDDGESAVNWWESLSTESREDLSPRRLEYALQALYQDIDLGSILFSKKISVKDFKTHIEIGSPMKLAKSLVAMTDAKIKKEMTSDTTISVISRLFEFDDLDCMSYCNKLLKYFPKEFAVKEIVYGRMHKAFTRKKNPVSPSELYEISEQLRELKNDMSPRFKELFEKSFPDTPEKGFSYTTSSQQVEIDGKLYNVDDIKNPTQHKKITGRRFKMTSEQVRRVVAGKLTRETAYQEYLLSLKRPNDNQTQLTFVKEVETKIVNDYTSNGQ